jgi:uncharacterized protein YkwD
MFPHMEGKYITILAIVLAILAIRTGVVVIDLDPKHEVASEPIVEAANPPQYTPPPAPPELNSEKLWSLVQAWRQSAGFKTYTKDRRLCEMAQVRLGQIKTDWSHYQFQGVVDRYFYGKYDYSVGENLAREEISEQSTLDQWLLSPDHRENLDAPYKYSCIVTEGGYAVQFFANY